MSSTQPRRTDVTLEDQQQINLFSRLNAHMHEVDDKLKSLRREMEDLEEGESEVMLSDEEKVPMVVGECLVYVARDVVEERLGKLKEGAEEEEKRLKEEMTRIREEMDELKKVLYARFGDSIHLEE